MFITETSEMDCMKVFKYVYSRAVKLKPVWNPEETGKLSYKRHYKGISGKCSRIQ